MSTGARHGVKREVDAECMVCSDIKLFSDRPCAAADGVTGSMAVLFHSQDGGSTRHALWRRCISHVGGSGGINWHQGRLLASIGGEVKA
jgi:hypothetical protein